jgi:hypothetical protein
LVESENIRRQQLAQQQQFQQQIQEQQLQQYIQQPLKTIQIQDLTTLKTQEKTQINQTEQNYIISSNNTDKSNKKLKPNKRTKGRIPKKNLKEKKNNSNPVSNSLSTSLNKADNKIYPNQIIKKRQRRKFKSGLNSHQSSKEQAASNSNGNHSKEPAPLHITENHLTTNALFHSPASVLTKLDLKTFFQPTVFESLPRQSQLKLVKLLPECDRQLDSHGSFK